MEQFQRLARDYNCAILLIHHLRKPRKGESSDVFSLRGSGQIPHAADLIYTLEQQKGVGIVVTCNKSRDFEKPEPFIFNIKDYDDGKKTRLIYVGTINKDTQNKVQVARSIIPTIMVDEGITEENALSVEEIRFMLSEREVYIGENSLREALSQLVAEDKLDITTGQNNKRFYFPVDNKSMPGGGKLTNCTASA